MDASRNYDRIRGPDAKRRKVRKGTRSCWECKRRKVRCSFATPSDEVCVPCCRRGATCISQEFPEDLVQTESTRGQTDRIVRVETLLKKLVGAVNQHNSGDGVSNNGVVSTTDDSNTQGLPTPTRAELHNSISWDAPRANKLEKVSQTLHATFPSRRDVNTLCESYKDAVIYAHQIHIKPHHELEAGGLETVGQLAHIPGPQSHPVVLAKWMLLFALFLQQCVQLQAHNLSEHPKSTAKRLKDTATFLVTTNEELFGTVESLECILLDTLFELNRGHFRRAWLATRRAMTAAQLMGLHRAPDLTPKTLDPTTKINPQFLLFRVIYLDRFISLMLGLPAASFDMKMPFDTALVKDISFSQLEQTHAAVAGRILERNECDSSVDDFALTEAIDAELLAAAENLPSKFWLPINFSGWERHDEQVFWEATRLVTQLYHFNLLNQLHLPYLLRFSDDIRCCSSRITSVNASREVLTRWTAFRSVSSTPSCCRSGDFFALVAALTLCLAHLGNHHSVKPHSSLRHQRLGDRVLIEQALQGMEIVATQGEDPLTRKSANLLRRLLIVEADAAQGQIYSARKFSREESTNEGEEIVLSIPIPYFGVIKISREGAISKEPNTTQPPPTRSSETYLQGSGMDMLQIGNNTPLVDFRSVYGNTPASFAGASSDHLAGVSEQYPVQTPTSACSGRCDPQQEQFPCPIAGVDDWAFQGVDMAFFDSLMKGMTDAAGQLPNSNGTESTRNPIMNSTI
ncbi:hypothetical protein CC78DRAFT_476397 [Lojkania enalia]|uniref:Zn(2)-C6 fungal-type domain-containing protein n=1 Tax=Lojkania enalia TaxID=147567 RepID=A0A9P4JY64_9PLEO|nr:hypothetical protein CC78DRAFT_476397 [Didymosphaeria enalia]